MPTLPATASVPVMVVVAIFVAPSVVVPTVKTPNVVELAENNPTESVSNEPLVAETETASLNVPPRKSPLRTMRFERS